MLTLQAPSSKSMSHRMLMGAACASGESVVRRVLMSKDIECTMAALRGAGAHFTPMAETLENQEKGVQSFWVLGMDSPDADQRSPSIQKTTDPISCDMHESGTSCRLLTALLSTCNGLFHIHGAPRLHQRPMHALTQALSQLGTQIRFLEKEDHAPFFLQGHALVKNTSKNRGAALAQTIQATTEAQNTKSLPMVTIDSDASSQYLSGLLLAAPRMQGGLRITLGGKKVVSWPYVGLTLQVLENFGIPFSVEQKREETWQKVDWRHMAEAIPGATRFCVSEAPYRAGEYVVEGDWSGASYLIAAGALGTTPVSIRGLNSASLQGDRAILDILQAMGGNFSWQEIFTGKGDKREHLQVFPTSLHGITVDMGACPDLVPTVAVLAAFAQGETLIHNCAHLRIKESDRIAAPATELRKAGVTVEEREDGLRIIGLGKAPIFANETLFSTHNDHRMAMSLALLGLHGQTPQLDAPDVVQKSFPHFWDVWGQIHA